MKVAKGPVSSLHRQHKLVEWIEIFEAQIAAVKNLIGNVGRIEGGVNKWLEWSWRWESDATTSGCMDKYKGYAFSFLT